MHVCGRVSSRRPFPPLPGYVRRFIHPPRRSSVSRSRAIWAACSLATGQERAVDPLLAALEIYPAQQRSFSVGMSDPKTFCGQAGQTCVWIIRENRVRTLRELVRNRLGKTPFAARCSSIHGQEALHLPPRAADRVRKADSEIDDWVRKRPWKSPRGSPSSDGAGYSLSIEHLLCSAGVTGCARSQRLAVIARQHRDLAQAYLAERVARTMAVERRSRLLNTLSERETFIKRGFDFQEAELAGARAKLSPKAAEGNKAAAQHLVGNQGAATGAVPRRDKALAILRREPELIVPGAVEFIAHALVVPSTDQATLNAIRPTSNRSPWTWCAPSRRR